MPGLSRCTQSDFKGPDRGRQEDQSQRDGGGGREMML